MRCSVRHHFPQMERRDVRSRDARPALVGLMAVPGPAGDPARMFLGYEIRREYVAGALSLYLDAFNIFLALIRILNAGRR